MSRLQSLCIASCITMTSLLFLYTLYWILWILFFLLLRSRKLQFPPVSGKAAIYRSLTWNSKWISTALYCAHEKAVKPSSGFYVYLDRLPGALISIGLEWTTESVKTNIPSIYLRVRSWTLNEGLLFVPDSTDYLYFQYDHFKGQRETDWDNWCVFSSL